MFKKFSSAAVALVVSLSLALSGCATGLGDKVAQGAQKVAPDAIPDMIKVLQAIKANPIVATVGKDAAATRAWADKVLGPGGTNPDPLKYQLANACPTATDAVKDSINETIDGMIAELQAIQAPPDPNAPQGYLMLFLTQLKYGPASQSPQDRFNALRAKFQVQLDALFTGCMHLFPKKQMNDLVRLAVRFGAISASGGAAAPFLSYLQSAF